MWQVFSQVLHAATKAGYVLPPDDMRTFQEKEAEEAAGLDAPQGKYHGAFVLEPEVGVHTCVAINDFSSLYPSICIGWNLCYTTFVPEGSPFDNLPDVTYHTTWIDDGVDEDGVPLPKRRMRFVQADTHKGLLPSIMEHLLSYRKATRKQMKGLAKTDPKYGILDGRQLALKVSANSGTPLARHQLSRTHP